MTSHRRPRTSRPPRRDRGATTVEVVLIAPLVMAVLLLTAAFGRVVSIQLDVDAAAHAAARAASLARTHADAHTDAAHAARTVLDARSTCGDLHVDVDTSGLSAPSGGVAAATVTCAAPLSDVAAAGFPGAMTVTGRSESPVDTWRSRP